MPTLGNLLDILKKMMSPTGYNHTTAVQENGQERVETQHLANLSPAEALEKLDQVVAARWPEEEALPQKLEEFRNMSSPTLAQPKDMASHFDQHPEEMASRLAYSKLCYQAMRPILLHRAEQSEIWESLERSFFGVDEKGLAKKSISTLRFGPSLMKTDGSPESQRYNEKIYGLMAVASGKLNMDQFEARRYQTWLDAKMSPEQARDAAKKERDYGLDAILDIYKEQVNSAQAKMDQALEAAGMILGGKETDLKKLTDAYTLIHNPGFEMMFIGTSAFRGFTSRLNNYEARQEELEALSAHYEAISTELKPSHALADETASPYYSYLDVKELTDGHLVTVKEDAQLADYITIATGALGQGFQYNARPFLEKYDFQEILDQDFSTSDMLVYYTDRDGHMEYLLLGVDDLGLENGLKMTLNENVPGRLVDKGLDQDVQQLLEQYHATAGENPSKAFAQIGKALEGLRGQHLGESAETTNRHDMGRSLHDLQKAADSYLAVENDFVILGDETRSATAKAVKAFTEKKLNQLDFVDRHVYTIQQQVNKMERQRADAQKTFQAIAKGAAAYERASQYGEPSQDQLRSFSDTQLQIYIDKRDMNYESQTDAARANKSFASVEPENDRRSKEIVAANVVQELLNNEALLFPNPKDRCMLLQLSSDGKVDSLVQMVQESESFFEHVRSQDLSTKEARNTLLDNGVHKQVAKDIMKTVLANQRERNNLPPKVDLKAEPKPNKAQQKGKNPFVG